MTHYEYIRLDLDMGDLEPLNRLANIGWHVVAVVDDVVTGAHGYKRVAHYALLERLLESA